MYIMYGQDPHCGRGDRGLGGEGGGGAARGQAQRREGEQIQGDCVIRYRVIVLTDSRYRVIA